MADLGINKSHFQVISEPGTYVFAILQQKYDFSGNEYTTEQGDIWIFAYQENGMEDMVRYKRVPYNYTIQQIRDVAWKFTTDIPGVAGPFNGDSVIQSPNGRIWLTAYKNVGSLIPNYLNPPQQSSLVAWWKLEEASGSILDETSNNYDGTYNGALYRQTGKINYALGFDGSNDSVVFGNINILGGSSSFTIAAWIYLDTYNTDGSSQRTIVMDRVSTNVFQFHVNPSSVPPNGSGIKKLGIGIWIGGVSYHRYSTADIPLSTWTHVVATYNGSVLRLYINGVEDSGQRVPDSNPSGSIDSGSTDFRMGYGIYVDGNYWDGVLDEILIWKNRALTATEILAFYNDVKLFVTYYDGTSWQSWVRFNNRDLIHYHESGVTIDGTNVVFAYLLNGGEANETPNIARELYYKSVSQGIAIGDIQATSDTYVLTLGVNAVWGYPILKTSSGNYIFIYQKATTQSPNYTSTLYCRTASTIPGLATATEVTIVANYVVSTGVSHPSITEILTTKTLVAVYDKTNATTIAYKTSTDEGVTWSSETVVSTDFGGDNIILADLNDKLHVGTNNYTNGQYTPYLCRVPRIAVTADRGCPLCGSLSWKGLVPDPQHPKSRPLHPGPQAAGRPLKNDDPKGRGPHYFKCAQCGWILDIAKTQSGPGHGNVFGYTL